MPFASEDTNSTYTMRSEASLRQAVRPAHDGAQDAASDAERLSSSGRFPEKAHRRKETEGQKEIYRGAEYEVTLISKDKIEVVAENNQTKNVVNTIIKDSKTNKIGD